MADDITRLLKEMGEGNKDAEAELFVLALPELRRRAAYFLSGERRGHTLQPTALINEAYLGLLGITGQADWTWQNRAHFFAIAAREMRNILIDHARRRGAEKRGGEFQRVTLEQLDNIAAFGQEDVETILALYETLDRLAELDERAARVVELRFITGLTVDEVAAVLSRDGPKRVSSETVKDDWDFARKWMYRELNRHPPRS